MAVNSMIRKCHSLPKSTKWRASSTGFQRNRHKFSSMCSKTTFLRPSYPSDDLAILSIFIMGNIMLKFKSLFLMLSLSILTNIYIFHYGTYIFTL